MGILWVSWRRNGRPKDEIEGLWGEATCGFEKSTGVREKASVCILIISISGWLSLGLAVLKGILTMRKLMVLTASLCCFGAIQLKAADEPRGRFLELHSCELFAGGCIVSSESPLDGRYLLRAWNFDAGNFAGADFKGLRVAVLQTSSDNLAAERSKAERTVVYLPQDASPKQRAALTAWVKSNVSELGSVQTRAVPLRFSASNKGCSFSADRFLSVNVASLDECPTGNCGESLWYEPRSSATVFTVAVDKSSRVNEPLLSLRWDDAGKRNVFLAKFGDETAARNIYVSLAELCGPTGKLF